MKNRLLIEFISKHQLPESYLSLAQRHFDPLAKKILDEAQASQNPIIIGLNGAQGSGKTTLADYLCHFWANAGLKALSISLDDFYYSKQTRLALGEDVHPLLATRGVPGTHDTALMRHVLSSLKEGDFPLAIPRFDKSIDDRVPKESWPITDQRVDIVILEGWCWGARHKPESSLSLAMNDLEELEDAQGIWRRYVNKKLEQEYESLYLLMDYWLMLKAPSFDCVFEWRLEQEQKLAAKSSARNSAVMNEEQIGRFIKHYERITRSVLEDLPSSADLVWYLDGARQICKLTSRQWELPDEFS